MWLLSGSIFERVEERVIYDAMSQWEARLYEFISPNREWIWSQVSIKLIDLG